MTRIPVELYRLVVSFIEQSSDLAQLALVDKAFNSEVEPVLWHEITIDNMENGRMICETLCATQFKSGLVAQVTINCFLESWQDTDEIRLSAIAALRNISCMRVTTENELDWMTKLTQPYKYLQHFKCYQPDEHAIAFIQRHPDIRSLRLGGILEQLFLDDLRSVNASPVAPSLDTIQAYSDLIAYYVPGNPLRSIDVQLSGHQSPVESIISDCGRSTRTLERLCLVYPDGKDDAFTFKPEHISLMAQHIPDLKELVIDAPMRTNNIYRDGGEHARPYFEALSKLRKLETVKFRASMGSFWSWGGKMLVDSDEHSKTCNFIVKTIIETSPHLSQVSFVGVTLPELNGLSKI